MTNPPINTAGTSLGQVREPMPGVVYPSLETSRRYRSQGVFTNESLPAAFIASFQRHADRIALIDVAGSLSYRDLDEVTDRLASGLLDLGLQPLDRAIFQIPNSREVLLCLIACWKAGIIPICTLASHREAEIGYLARHGQAAVHFVRGDDPKFDFVSFAGKICADVPSLRHIIATGSPTNGDTPVIRLDALISAQEPTSSKARVRGIVENLDPCQVAVFQLSGGTTGVPKMIPRFHNEYLYNMRAVYAWNGRTQDEVVYSAGPFVHNAAMACHWGPGLLFGSTIITDPDMSVDGLRHILDAYRPTWLYVPRPLLGRLTEAARTVDFDGSSVAGVVTASNSRTVREELGMMGVHIFGMAEGLIMTTQSADPIAARDVTVGRPVSPYDEVRILKPGTEEPVAMGEIGEMVCKGPYTLHGYYDAEERNRDAFTRDGFYRSGDLMSARLIDGSTYYVFEGRLKDVINRGGEKINCDEVERALRSYPGVVDVAIVAMPDDIYIERGCAFVCLEKGHDHPTVASFGVHLERAGLARFKWPERVEIIDALPMTNANKISKPILREAIAAKIKQERQSSNDPLPGGSP